eukprot:jgi/Botrbrau1/2680/Bobra.0203s0024.1
MPAASDAKPIRSLQGGGWDNVGGAEQLPVSGGMRHALTQQEREAKEKVLLPHEQVQEQAKGGRPPALGTIQYVRDSESEHDSDEDPDDDLDI